MIADRRALLRVILVLADFCSALLAFGLAATFRFGADWYELSGSALPPRPMRTVPVIAVVLIAVFWFAGLYRLRKRWSLRAEVRDIARALVVALGLTFAVLYLFRLDEVSRIFIASYFVILAAGAVSARAVLRVAYDRRARRAGSARRILLVGGGDAAQQFLSRISGHAEMPITVVGVVDDEPPTTDGPWLGRIADLPAILAAEIVDEVAVCLPWSRWDVIDAVVRHSEQQGKVVRIPVHPLEYAIARGSLEDVDGLPVLSLVTGPDQVLALWGKRLMDLAGASLLLVFTAPIFVAGAIAIGLTDGWPILFRQERGGLNGRPFTALKFRTMVRDAEALKAELEEGNERVGPAFKLRHDPRVTRVGRWLRKTSMDELPQLLNVLRGDMSLVGPRPQPMCEVREYDLWHRRRLSVKPGLTGLWQVTARHEASFDRWVELDLNYIDQWSLWQDAKLIARTPLALLRSPGT